MTIHHSKRIVKSFFWDKSCSARHFAALHSAGVGGNLAAVRVVRDHRSVNAMHSATLEGPERFTQAAAAAQVTAAPVSTWRVRAVLCAGKGQSTTAPTDARVAEAGSA
jgi:hypothetical protein